MNIKRPLSILAILLACTMIFTACSGKNADKADDESDDDAPVVGDYQDEEDVPVVEDDGFTIWNIKLAHGGNEETAQQMGALAMKEYIEETSEGRITVEIYSDGSMGDDRELCDNVQQGALEMCLTNSAQVEFVPDAAVYDLYFQYRNTPAVIDKFRNDDAFINTMSRTYWQAGYKLGGFSVHGFRQTTANKEIREPGDLTELTLGVQDNEYRMEGWKAMGATPVPYGSGELYNVLQQGTVDAQENAIETIYAQKLYEQQRYVIMTHHQQEVQTWLISTKFYNSLPPGMQRIVMDGVQVGCDTAQNHAISTEYEWRKAMENTGTVFVEINTTEYNTFKDKIGPQREMIQNAVSPEVWEAYVGAEEQAQEE